MDELQVNPVIFDGWLASPVENLTTQILLSGGTYVTYIYTTKVLQSEAIDAYINIFGGTLTVDGYIYSTYKANPEALNVLMSVTGGTYTSISYSYLYYTAKTEALDAVANVFGGAWT